MQSATDETRELRNTKKGIWERRRPAGIFTRRVRNRGCFEKSRRAAGAPRLSFIALLAVFLAAPLTAAPPAKLALTGGRIVPVVGAEISKGTLLIENGRIKAVGAEVEVPFDALEVDCTGKVLFPGMIDPQSARGLDAANERLPVTPFVDVYDAIDPSRVFFEDTLRNGVTTVHVMPGNNCVIGGLSRIVRPIGRTPDEMTVRERLALKLSTTPRRGYDRMLQVEMLRETFAELDDYLARLAESKYEESLKEKDEEIDVGPAEARKRGKKLIGDEDLDDKHRNLVKLRDGRLGAWIYCGAAMDVRPAVKLAKDQGFLERTVLVLGTGTHRAIEELKAAGRPVVLSPELVHRERDPITGELKETFIPAVIHAAGLEFALQPAPESSLAERLLNYQAARLVRRGIPRADALRAITLHPAKIIGMGDELGSLEAGKIANVVVLSGDPLDFNSWVEKVYIDGILAYDRDKDVRLETLLGEEEEEEKKEEEPEEKKDEKPAEKETDKKDEKSAVPDEKPSEKPSETGKKEKEVKNES